MGVCSASGSDVRHFANMEWSHSILLSVLFLAACQSQPAVTKWNLQSEALVKRADRYGWKVQLVVRDPDKEYERIAWFTMPHAGRMPVPLEDCTEVAARASYSNGGGWTQASGPKWHGYVSYDPERSPDTLEIRCIERSSCACRHFEHSDLSGIHSVKKLGLWQKPPIEDW